MYGALAAGWGVPAVALALALTFSGVSFRFGDTCHINHTNGLADFWTPLLVFAAITVAVQFATFGYCIKVYLASLSDSNTTSISSGLPSYAGTVRTVSPRQAYRRVRRVVQLQWRGLAIVLIIIGDVIFFSVVFVVMDNTETTVFSDPIKSADWITCLVEHRGNKDSCLRLANNLVVNEATVIAVLVLLSLNGLWLLLLMGRFSMFTGWYGLVKARVRPNREFVSVDARSFGKDCRSYEMLTLSGKEASIKVPDNVLSPISPPTWSGRRTPDYFGRAVSSEKPTMSFSSPKSTDEISWPTTSAGWRHQPNPLSMNKI
ncbi:MAG: hypothetical protein M1818_001462 [Claussenomyces sp. TS43310]|nr:MAG: hypothetical protein M1818_001462 [Claussenomyces sp. TS43310]